ncbi:hypothetical protein MKX01_022984 [Papaver californicum]|nr:hypothetical protein MKX01_022984 [Papaver californicum]
MDRLIRASQRTYLFHSTSSSRSLFSRLLRPLCDDIQKPSVNSFFQSRTYLSEMRNQRSATRFNSFSVEDRPGEKWIRLRRKYGEEDIKIEVTMFDGSVPAPKIGDDDEYGSTQLHISLICFEFVYSAWPDCLEIDKVFMLRRNGIPAKPYVGPDFKYGIPSYSFARSISLFLSFVDFDVELQSSLQEFLEARGVNEELADFLHEYMMNKDKTEFIRWMGNIKSFIEN